MIGIGTGRLETAETTAAGISRYSPPLPAKPEFGQTQRHKSRANGAEWPVSRRFLGSEKQLTPALGVGQDRRLASHALIAAVLFSHPHGLPVIRV